VVGNRAVSFAAFYDGNYPSVCRALALAFRDPQVAEEAAQEAFIRAYVYWRRVGRMDRPAGWVYVVAVRQAFRKRGRRVEEVPMPLGTEVPALDFADGIVEREALRVAIARLPERQRLAIVLRYLGDLPLADVAAAMGCAVGTVKSTVHAALTRLEADLGEEIEATEEVHPDAH
jgi:RNA polymerase sigma-70 factor (sigma-E family)